MKRGWKFRTGLLLLILTGIGLTISTLHTHYHLEWNHPPDFADTGHCVSIDTTVCPISGYIFETEVLSASYASDIYFSAEEVIAEKNIHLDDPSTAVIRGRSPPALL